MARLSILVCWVAIGLAACGTPEDDRLLCDVSVCPYGCYEDGSCKDATDPCATMDCPFGCQNGVCLTDPCADLVCDFGCKDGACLSDPGQCGNGAVEANEQCDSGAGCGIDCRCAYGYESLGNGGCRRIGSAILTDQTSESIALQSVQDLVYTEGVQGLDGLDAAINPSLDGAMRGAMRGKAVKGAVPSALVDGDSSDLPECAKLGTDKSACCSAANPCQWGTNNICECDGQFDWDASDCSASEQCCKEGDPCGWGNDTVCDCQGQFDWNVPDCQSNDDYCCKPDDPCGWADNGICNCDTNQAWDAADCANTEVDETFAVIEFDGDCEVDGVVFSGTFSYNHWTILEHQDAKDLLQEETVIIYGDEYTQDGVAYEGRVRYHTDTSQTQVCGGLKSSVTYVGLNTPESG